jgi:hypothetical protein
MLPYSTSSLFNFIFSSSITYYHFFHHHHNILSLRMRAKIEQTTRWKILDDFIFTAKAVPQPAAANHIMYLYLSFLANYHHFNTIGCIFKFCCCRRRLSHRSSISLLHTHKSMNCKHALPSVGNYEFYFSLFYLSY